METFNLGCLVFVALAELRPLTASVSLCLPSPQFSRDQFILDCPSEKLRKELEEELKMDCEEPRSHAWYHGAIPRQVALTADGERTEPVDMLGPLFRL